MTDDRPRDPTWWWRQNNLTGPGAWCCTDMQEDLHRLCSTHEDRADCPDALIKFAPDTKSGENSYGLWIHDGGSSFIQIHYCPWCGKGLT